MASKIKEIAKTYNRQRKSYSDRRLQVSMKKWTGSKGQERDKQKRSYGLSVMFINILEQQRRNAAMQETS